MGEPAAHWERVYQARADDALSWYRSRLDRSLALIERVAPSRGSAVIDAGGGSSTLVDGLLEAGFTDVSVLDLSGTALDRSRRRLGDAAAKVDWIEGDVTRWRPGRTFDLWHDRAVFHFLTEAPGQDAYLATLEAALAAGGHAVVATFAPAGPEWCSGLPVQRYSPASLAARFGPGFRLIAGEEELHRTPAGVMQPFTYAVLRKNRS